MSGYSLSNSAPVNNPGYYDTPIHNQYSNPERNGPYKQLTGNQFNSYIGDEFNSNENNYEVYQMQSYPSTNLFESFSNQNDYTNNDNSHSGSQLVIQDRNIEMFENESIDSQPNRLDMNKKMRNTPINRNQNLMDNQQPQQPQRHQPQRHQPHQKRQNITYNNFLPRQPAIQRNDYYYDSPGYLNVGSIPNIAGLYNNNIQRRPETIIIKEVNNDAKITDYNSDDDDDDDDLDDSIQTKKLNDLNEVKETKISNLKRKLEKGKKLKKKKNNMMYLVIFLLIIIVGLMLYIILNPKAAKKVRF